MLTYAKFGKGVPFENITHDPEYASSVHAYATRGSDLNYVPDYANFSPNTFHYTVVREWNALPVDIKSQRTLSGFKRDLKRHLTD